MLSESLSLSKRPIYSFLSSRLYLSNKDNVYKLKCGNILYFWFYAGGGWTLAVSISSKNNDHLQSAANNCLNSVLCVPFTDKNQGRKLSDSDIHEVAKEEGEYEKKTNNNNDNNNKNGNNSMT